MGGGGWLGQRRSVSRSPPTPPPPTTIAATTYYYCRHHSTSISPTMEAVILPPQATMSKMPESLTSSVTHPLLSAKRSHQRLQPIDEGDKSASDSTTVGYGNCCYIQELFTGRFTQWKSDLHKYFERFDDPADAVAHGCPLDGTQLPPDTPMEKVPPALPRRPGEDAGLHIMLDTFDSRLGPRPGKVYQGVGNACHREMGALSSTFSSGQVASLTEKVAELEQQVMVQHKHIAMQSAHIATQEAYIVA
ncbi:hypothetical protein D8674_026747 [Pyrus ussuriensis x Pyrus communis]|uniref:Uncharacterized protein n=1 Tax=Pyrus ussuriensis x Pyrus communis TaxID=2448454 RepID=A0A5N5IAS6_9ROSA|nr:hypothetical protein D8674_026747 [Pyrus ussuriensis x Pyrus communis]